MKIKKAVSNKNGYIFPLVFMVIIVLSILLLAVNTIVLSNYKNATYWSNKIKALYLAESGINHALYSLNKMDKGNSPPDIIESKNLLGERQSYRVELTQKGLNEMEMRSTGTYHGVQRTVTLDGICEGETIFPSPISEIEEGQENYDPNYQEVDINLPPFPENSDNVPPSAVYVEGDLIIDDIDSLDTYSIIYEQKSDNSELVITCPELIYINGDLIVKNGNGVDSVTVNNDVTFYVNGNFSLENSQTLTLNGSTNWYIYGENDNAAVFGENSKLYPKQRTNFHISGNLEFKNSSIAGQEQAINAVFFLTGTDYMVDLKNDSNVIAGIYNPNGTINLDNKVKFEGRLVGKEVDIHNQADFIDDDSLEEVKGPNSGTWKPGAWKEG